MKQEEVKAMVKETTDFVSDVVRKVPANQSEELSYMMTMAALFYEVAKHRASTSAVT